MQTQNCCITVVMSLQNCKKKENSPKVVHNVKECKHRIAVLQNCEKKENTPKVVHGVKKNGNTELLYYSWHVSTEL